MTLVFGLVSLKPSTLAYFPISERVLMFGLLMSSYLFLMHLNALTKEFFSLLVQRAGQTV